LTHLSGHGGETHHGHVMSVEETIAYEKDVFEVAKFYHILSFLAILASLELKRRGWYIIGQGL